MEQVILPTPSSGKDNNIQVKSVRNNKDLSFKKVVHICMHIFCRQTYSKGRTFDKVASHKQIVAQNYMSHINTHINM